MGGSGGGGDSYDAEYNKRIATLMEAEGVRAESQYDWEQQYLQPYEQAMMSANRSLMPGQTALAKEQIGANRALLPGQTALAKEQMGYNSAQIGAGMSLLPGQTSLAREQMGYDSAQIKAGMSLLPGQTRVAGMRLQNQEATLPGLYKTLGKHDVGGAMNTATADMATAFDARDQENNMTMRGMGMTPNSSAFQSNQNSMSKALGVAGARTTARSNTETRNLNEKIQGLQL